MVLPLVPELPDLIGTTAGNASWMVTATLVAGAVATPVISRMADMYGKRRMILVTLAIVALGALVGAFAPSLPFLILARALQGMGMALVPVGIATMRDELEPEQVPLAVALMSATLAIGAGVGLPLGGYMAQVFDWHVVLWLPGVLALLMIALVLLTVSESSVRTAGAFDVRGAVLLSLALVLLLLAVSKGSDWGWLDVRTLGCFAAGLLLLGLFIPLELRIPNPLVDIRTASQPVVVAANTISVFMGFAMFVNMLVSTQLLQTPKETGYGLGLDALHAGLWMAPSAAAFGLLAPISGWVTRRFGPELAIGAGAAIMAVSYLARIPFSHSIGLVVLGTITVTVGTALAYSALPTLIMRSVPVTETAAANGLNTLLRSVGTSTASAVTTAVLAATITASGFPTYTGMATVFGLATAASLISLGLILPFLRQRSAEVPARPGVEEQKADHVVHGRITDAAGQPLPGAVVTVLGGQGSHVDWSHTDSAGDLLGGDGRPDQAPLRRHRPGLGTRERLRRPGAGPAGAASGAARPDERLGHRDRCRRAARGGRLRRRHPPGWWVGRLDAHRPRRALRPAGAQGGHLSRHGRRPGHERHRHPDRRARWISRAHRPGAAGGDGDGADRLTGGSAAGARRISRAGPRRRSSRRPSAPRQPWSRRHPWAAPSCPRAGRACPRRSRPPCR